MRLDKWLWAARFFKTRTLASAAVDAGKVQLNGSRSKPARDTKVSDRLDINHGETRSTVIVKVLSDHRGPADTARLLYAETPASIAAREAQRTNRKLVADPAADIHGRPTKRDRRQLNRVGDT